MALDNPSDVLPILTDAHRGFDAAIRGYDRAQVDQFFSDMDEELRAAVANRDAIAGRSADLAAQLASAQAQIESLRRQLRKASETVTAETVDKRVSALLGAANTEAAKIRSAAETEATALRAGATDAAARTRAAAQAEAQEILATATERHAEADDTFRRRLAEAEVHRADVEALLVQSITQARTEEDRVTAESESSRVRLDAESLAERERRDAESLAHRAQAEEDFEVTLRRRRTAEAAASAELKAAADALAAQQVSDAAARATELVDAAVNEVRRLNDQRDETHAELRELYRKLGAAVEQPLAADPPAAVDSSSGGA
jgi:cell division septum initiation protein DivIVA